MMEVVLWTVDDDSRMSICGDTYEELQTAYRAVAAVGEEMEGNNAPRGFSESRGVTVGTLRLPTEDAFDLRNVDIDVDEETE